MRVKNSKTLGVWAYSMESELFQEYRAEGFRVNDKIRNKLSQSKRHIERRLDKNDNTGCRQATFKAANIPYETPAPTPPWPRFSARGPVPWA